MSIVISAIICTHNRIGYLRKALQSLTQQSLSESLYEIIVVDNRSTDNTKEVVLDEFSEVNNLSYIFEPVLGLSQARNTGLHHASGKYVAFLDDDAIADKKWLENIVRVFEKVDGKVGAVGGKISPIWEAPRPVWLSDTLARSLTILDWSEHPTTLTSNEWLAGANIAFPKEVLLKFGGFKTDLGRKGKSLLSDEEALLRHMFDRNGYTSFYDPDIFVYHHIPAERLKKRWFIRRQFCQGISTAVLEMYADSLRSTERMQRVYSTTVSLLNAPGSLINLLLPSQNPERFTRKCTTLKKCGYIYGLLRLRLTGI